jgi:hypothetical protein
MRGGAVPTAGRLVIVGSVVAATGAGLLAAAGPANAASISAPNVITRPSTVTISAKTDAVQAARLLFNGNVVASAGALQLGSTLSYEFSTGSLRNGAYSAVLTEQVLVLPWRTAASATITLRVPPAPPSGVGARLVSGRTVRVTWAKGAEPDLTSYDVVSTAGAGASGLGVGSVCGGGGCAATLTVPAAAGPSVGFAVVAHRSDGAGGTLASSASPAAYVGMPAAGGSGSGTGSGGGGGPGSGVGQGGASPGSGGQYARLQALSGGSSLLVLPTVGPQSGLALPGSQRGTASARPRGSWLMGAWYPGLAVVLILLLVVAHLAAWTRRSRRAP